MNDASLQFLKTMLETPSPSGYEAQIQKVVRDWAQNYADEIHTDRHGNLHCIRKGSHSNSGKTRKLMLAGHCDQIALMVQHIDENGYLYVQPIGGWDM